MVADLAAALRVERRDVQEDADVLALLGHRELTALGVEHRDDLRVALQVLVADELGRRAPRRRRCRSAPSSRRRGRASAAPPGAPRTGRRRPRARPRPPAPRVSCSGNPNVSESLNASSPDRTLRSCVLLDGLLEQLQPLAERGREPLLLRRRHLQHERLVLAELGVDVAPELGRPSDQRLHDRPLDAEPARVRDDAAEHPAQDVAAAFVRRLHAVGDQERGRAAVLGDHLERDVVALVRSVPLAGQRLDHLEERTERVGLEVVVLALQQRGDALEARAGVDVLRGELADDLEVRVDLVLDEHQVPDLHEPVLVDVGTALRPVPRAAIDEDLRARPAGTGGVRVPVVRQLAFAVEAAASHDPLGRYACRVDPDRLRLGVVLVHRDPQQVVLDPESLGDQLVRPRDRVGLEVVAEREVPEHLEHRQVAGRVADVLDVVGAEALLARDGPQERRRRLSQEVRDELVHARVREQQAGLRRRDQGRRRDTAMSPLFEERQERLADAMALHAGESTDGGAGHGTPDTARSACAPGTRSTCRAAGGGIRIVSARGDDGRRRAGVSEPPQRVQADRRAEAATAMIGVRAHRFHHPGPVAFVDPDQARRDERPIGGHHDAIQFGSVRPRIREGSIALGGHLRGSERGTMDRDPAVEIRLARDGSQRIAIREHRCREPVEVTEEMEEEPFLVRPVVPVPDQRPAEFDLCLRDGDGELVGGRLRLEPLQDVVGEIGERRIDAEVEVLGQPHPPPRDRRAIVLPDPRPPAGLTTDVLEAVPGDLPDVPAGAWRPGPGDEILQRPEVPWMLVRLASACGEPRRVSRAGSAERR